MHQDGGAHKTGRTQRGVKHTKKKPAAPETRTHTPIIYHSARRGGWKVCLRRRRRFRVCVCVFLRVNVCWEVYGRPCVRAFRPGAAAAARQNDVRKGLASPHRTHTHRSPL